jgi:hypothetical protein
MFMPTAMVRNEFGVVLNWDNGIYWSATEVNNTSGWALTFSPSMLDPGISSTGSRTQSYPIRCVKPNLPVTALAEANGTAKVTSDVAGTHVITTAAQGSAVTFTATPASSLYKLTSWSAEGITLTDAQKTSNPLTLSMPGNALTLTARFGINDTPNIIDPQPAGILYWDSATQTMQLGNWQYVPAGGGGRVNQANALFFKFGSVIATTVVPTGTGGGIDTFDASNIMFNPTNEATWNTINNYADWFAESGTTYNQATHAVDGFISSSAYHNAANVLTGRGDPCKLAGLTMEQIKAGVIDNKRFRLPTQAENVAAKNTYAVYGSRPSGYYSTTTTFGIYLIPDVNTFLPASGRRDNGGGTNYTGMLACYWGSAPSGNNAGGTLGISNDGGNLSNTATTAAYGNAVRCMKQ